VQTPPFEMAQASERVFRTRRLSGHRGKAPVGRRPDFGSDGEATGERRTGSYRGGMHGTGRRAGQGAPSRSGKIVSEDSRHRVARFQGAHSGEQSGSERPNPRVDRV